MAILVSWLGPVVVVGVTFALTAALPGRIITGYVRSEVPPHKLLRYSLNGVAVLAVVVSCCLGGLFTRVLSASALVDGASTSMAASCVLGVVLSVVFYVRGRALQGRKG